MITAEAPQLEGLKDQLTRHLKHPSNNPYRINDETGQEEFAFGLDNFLTGNQKLDNARLGRICAVLEDQRLSHLETNDRHASGFKHGPYVYYGYIPVVAVSYIGEEDGVDISPIAGEYTRDRFQTASRSRPVTRTFEGETKKYQVIWAAQAEWFEFEMASTQLERKAMSVQEIDTTREP